LKLYTLKAGDGVSGVSAHTDLRACQLRRGGRIEPALHKLAAALLEMPHHEARSECLAGPLQDALALQGTVGASSFAG
jgi:hypothetical protein